VDYNPVLAAQTGMYGNARVWVKGIGYIGPQNAQAVAVAAPAATPVIIADPNAANTNAMLATLAQAVNALVSAQAGAKAQAEPVPAEIVQAGSAEAVGAEPVDAFAGVIA